MRNVAIVLAIVFGCFVLISIFFGHGHSHDHGHSHAPQAPVQQQPSDHHKSID